MGFSQGLPSVPHLIQDLRVHTQPCQTPRELCGKLRKPRIPVLWRGYQLFRWNPKSQLSFPTPSPPRQERGTTHHQEMLCRVPRDQRELRDGRLFHQVLQHLPVQRQRRQQHPDQLRRGPAGNPGELGLCAQGGTLIRAGRRCHRPGSHKVPPK